jgi:hypothetical protein
VSLFYVPGSAILQITKGILHLSNLTNKSTRIPKGKSAFTTLSRKVLLFETTIQNLTADLNQ